MEICNLAIDCFYARERGTLLRFSAEGGGGGGGGATLVSRATERQFPSIIWGNVFTRLAEAPLPVVNNLHYKLRYSD